MTEDILKRLRSHVNDRGGPAKDDDGKYIGAVWPMMLEAADLIEQQSASLAAKDKEISTLKMALDDETSGISAACRDADTLAAKDAEIKRLGKCYDLAMKSRLEWRHRAEQAERALAEAVEVLRPFAEAGDDLDDSDKDATDIWEALCAMQINVGHLRAARAMLPAATTGENSD
jgi:hypothetical protein